MDVDSDSTFQCSPALHRRNGETCLPSSALQRLVNAWNKHHPDHKITVQSTRKKPGRSGGVLPGSTHKQLYSKLRKSMREHYKCNTEYCVVKKIPLPDSEKESMLDYFRPEKPSEWDSRPKQWLDSFNIEDVMNQYEKAIPEFEFIGPVPIDFDEKINGWGHCIVNELCKLKISDMKSRGKTKIGIIFNLDKHDEPGSHWVCAFIDIANSTAYYFDSYGIKPEYEILRLFERLKSQGIKNMYFNDIRHQREGSECGMYCLFCIICLIRGRPFYDICKHVVDDKTMNAFRDILFAEEHPRHESIEKSLEKLCA